MVSHIETLEEDLGKQETLTATLRKREACSKIKIRDMKDDYTKAGFDSTALNFFKLLMNV